MTHNNERMPKDISTFSRSHPLAVGQKWSVAPNARRGKVIPWPIPESDKSAYPTTTNVQIAIKDQVYAEELRGLLEEDNKHRVYVVDNPTLTMDGAVVVDETILQHLAMPTGTDASRYIVLCKGSSDPHWLWGTGVRCVVPSEDPPDWVRTVILGMELNLKFEQSPLPITSQKQMIEQQDRGQ